MPLFRCILAALSVSFLAVNTVAGQPSELSPVLFSDKADWQMGNYQSAKPDLSIALVDVAISEVEGETPCVRPSKNEWTLRRTNGWSFLPWLAGRL